MNTPRTTEMQRLQERMDTLYRLYEELQSGGIIGVVIKVGADEVLVHENLSTLLAGAESGLLQEACKLINTNEEELAELKKMYRAMLGKE